MVNTEIHTTLGRIHRKKTNKAKNTTQTIKMRSNTDPPTRG